MFQRSSVSGSVPTPIPRPKQRNEFREIVGNLGGGVVREGGHDGKIRRSRRSKAPSSHNRHRRQDGCNFTPASWARWPGFPLASGPRHSQRFWLCSGRYVVRGSTRDS